MSKYVLLTGSKNNAGDYLIKHRAKALLNHLRPDRAIVDFNAWIPLTAEQLTEINSSDALILCGGPSIQEGNRLRENIYPLTKNLSEITAPIIMMGSGYKGANGTWLETTQYEIAKPSLEILQRVNNSGYIAGVRDYHTLNVLQNKGFNNYLMTGCPALYSPQHIGSDFQANSAIGKIGVSLGVSYLRSNSMKVQMKQLIELLHSTFKESEIAVYFHHQIDTAVTEQKEFIEWLENNDYSYQDISGTADGLIQVYSQCDLHIGYRVHAHIFCSSISIPSVLISEDGRGIALKEVIGGLIFNGFDSVDKTIVGKVLNKVSNKDPFKAIPGLSHDVVTHLKYEVENNYPRMRLIRPHIDQHYQLMKKFIANLP